MRSIFRAKAPHIVTRDEMTGEVIGFTPYVDVAMRVYKDEVALVFTFDKYSTKLRLLSVAQLLEAIKSTEDFKVSVCSKMGINAYFYDDTNVRWACASCAAAYQLQFDQPYSRAA